MTMELKNYQSNPLKIDKLRASAQRRTISLSLGGQQELFREGRKIRVREREFESWRTLLDPARKP